jgi:hypothetical protein
MQRPLGVGLRTVRALQQAQASTLRPQAPAFVPNTNASGTGGTSGTHRNASVVHSVTGTGPFLPSSAFPPLSAPVPLQSRTRTHLIMPRPRTQDHFEPSHIQGQDQGQTPATDLGYPLYSFSELSPGSALHYITDIDTANQLLTSISPRGPLGFDLEWRPTFVKGVCLPLSFISCLVCTHAACHDAYSVLPFCQYHHTRVYAYANAS